MTVGHEAAPSRRALLKTGLKAGGIVAGAMLTPGVVDAAMSDRRRKPQDLLPPDFYRPAPPAARAFAAPRVDAAPAVAGISPSLMRRAMAAMDRHGSRLARRDRIAVADFSQSSARNRFFLVDLEDGSATSTLVAHGSGSDPSHTGFLQRFSNDNGSNASCEGAFLAADYYYGKHGKSQRLIGLDGTNDNALDRAIVVHAAWYANRDMLATHGMLGRSQGCFAVGENMLAEVFERLGPGRMIYAAKV